MEYFYSVLLSFLLGGAVCAAVQIVIDKTKLTPARILVGLVALGVLLYAVGLYEPLLSIFGSGVALPLLGFGGAIARGTREAVDSSGLIGALTGGLSATSSGIALTLSLGLLFSILFRPGAKRM